MPISAPKYLGSRDGSAKDSKAALKQQRIKNLKKEPYYVGRLQPLLLSYDEAQAEQTGVIVATMYRQGLIDGIKIAKLLNRYAIIHKFIGKWLPS
jgi:hypothetical protein